MLATLSVNALAHVRDAAGSPNLRVVNFSAGWDIELPVEDDHVHSRPLHIGFAKVLKYYSNLLKDCLLIYI